MPFGCMGDRNILGSFDFAAKRGSTQDDRVNVAVGQSENTRLRMIAVLRDKAPQIVQRLQPCRVNSAQGGVCAVAHGRLYLLQIKRIGRLPFLARKLQLNRPCI